MIELKINWNKNSIHKVIDKQLKTLRSKSTALFAKFGLVLRDLKNGQFILDQHSDFKGFNLSLFNKLIKEINLDYILSNLKQQGDSLNIERLKTRYNEFKEVYDDTLNTYLNSDEKDKLRHLEATITYTANSAKIDQKKKEIEFTSKQTDILPRLVALVFAMWTLSNAETYYDAKDVENQYDYLMLPHPAQVISLFRLLGIGDDPEDLLNNLVQVKTGEGKSLIIAIASCVLALLGFDISCACYSKYLSSRDFLEFENLFKILKVEPYIRYETFKKLTSILIKKDGDPAKILESIISNNKTQVTQEGNTEDFTLRPRILLIDEVDVFFSPEVFGGQRTIYAKIKHKLVEDLLKLVWVTREGHIPFEEIKEKEVYTKCLSVFGEFMYIIDEAINQMLREVMYFEDPPYEVIKGKIGYKEFDKISFHTNYGYRTTFAHFREFDKGNIDEQTLLDHCYLQVDAGDFSYIEMPLEFKFILGVSATLENLTKEQNIFIENKYKIKKKTFMPSFFGISKLTFNKESDLLLVDGFKCLFKEISQKIQRVLGDNRAALVFFENKNILELYLGETLKENLKSKIIVLTESDSHDEKKIKIRQASISGQITLITRSLGRGADFTSSDRELIASGGLHVIQTFFSETESEEVQIKGRAARQGQPGSFCLILDKNDLKSRFGISQVDLEQLSDKKLYDFLNSSRNAIFDDIYKSKIEDISEIEKNHRESLKFYKSIREKDLAAIKNYIAKNNPISAESTESPSFEKRTRLILFLVEGTKQMDNFLKNFQEKLDIINEKVSSSLKDNKENPCNFKIRIVLYKDYDAGTDKILTPSSMESKYANLQKSFFNKIQTSGTSASIDLALQYANLEAKDPKVCLAGVIIVGSCCIDNYQKIMEKRDNFGGGEMCWYKKYGFQAEADVEIVKLVKSNIPLEIYYTEERNLEHYKKLAALAGKDPSTLSKSEKILPTYFSKNILTFIGKSIGKEEALLASLKKKNV